jgi:tRNA dimethylallyltransferase
MNALQTVGYTEIFNWLDNTISLDKAVEQIKINTRQYAKRQMTWFKKDKEISWFELYNGNSIINAVKKNLQL